MLKTCHTHKNHILNADTAGGMRRSAANIKKQRTNTSLTLLLQSCAFAQAGIHPPVGAQHATHGSSPPFSKKKKKKRHQTSGWMERRRMSQAGERGSESATSCSCRQIEIEKKSYTQGNEHTVHYRTLVRIVQS